MTLKLIPYLSPTGLSPTRKGLAEAGLGRTNLPYRPDEIFATIKAVYSILADYGSNAVGLISHTHIRDKNGVDTLEPQDFSELARLLNAQNLTRNSAGGGVGLIYTSSVPNSQIPIPQRAKHILNAEANLLPLGGTCLWGDFNFGRSSFYNPPLQVKKYVNSLTMRGMIVENEILVFSEPAATQKMLSDLVEAIQNNVFKKPIYLNIVVGPSGLSEGYISKQIEIITKTISDAQKSVGIQQEAVIFIGGSIPPEMTIGLAVKHQLQGVRFGAGESRADSSCSWTDNSEKLALRLVSAAAQHNLNFTTMSEMLDRFKTVGLSENLARRYGKNDIAHSSP